MRNAGLWISLAVLLILTLTADSFISGAAMERAASDPHQTRYSVAANLAGQFRTVIANLLWMKADRYHHEYMEHNGQWAKDSDILPLMRLVTLFDPHFTQAYSAGAWMLGLYLGKPGPARSYLAEGIRNNPRSSDLHETMGLLAWRCDGNVEAALEHLRLARDYAERAFDHDRLSRSVRILEARMAAREQASRDRR